MGLAATKAPTMARNHLDGVCGLDLYSIRSCRVAMRADHRVYVNGRQTTSTVAIHRDFEGRAQFAHAHVTKSPKAFDEHGD